MIGDLKVSCLVNRSWDIASKKYVGESKNGTLIGISNKGEAGDTYPVGIIVFDDKTIDCVPVEFITKNEN